MGILALLASAELVVSATVVYGAKVDVTPQGIHVTQAEGTETHARYEVAADPARPEVVVVTVHF